MCKYKIRKYFLLVKFNETLNLLFENVILILFIKLVFSNNYIISCYNLHE